MNKKQIEEVFGGQGKFVTEALGITPRAWYGYTDPLPPHVINQVLGVMVKRKIKIRKEWRNG